MVEFEGVMFRWIIVVIGVVVAGLVPGVSTNTQRVCERDVPGTDTSRTPGDNGFRIKIAGRPQPEKYTPGQVYTVAINGTYSAQTMLGFMLVAVPLNAQDETTAMGVFQHLNTGLTKFAEECPHVITHTYRHQRAGVEVLWTAPPAGTGCIEFRATVVEYKDIWYKDDGALTRVFCEDTGTTENDQSPELLPECCACGTAKYQMTFHGTWSHRTHPKDYPTLKRLLHWSNIVGASHSKHYMIWKYGDYASKGIKEVCEFGYPRTLEQEMRTHSQDVRTVIKTPGIWYSEPHGLEQTRWARFSVDRKNHLLSMLTMLGPSPDWCVGVSALNLCLPNCTWAGNLEFNMMPWDAGTDDGVSYMSRNLKSEPQQKIHRITNTFPNNPASPFFSSEPIESLATLRIRRIHPKQGDNPSCSGADALDAEDDYDDTEIEESEDLSADEMEKKKLMMMNQGKCGTSPWGDWSECSVTCGVGERFRKRTFLNPMVDESMCGISEMEAEKCIGVENECESAGEDCAVSRWSDWSPCSVTCGKGIQSRERTYLNIMDMKRCSREVEQREMCIADMMDCDFALSGKNFTAICSVEKDIGPCRGSFQRFYYDTTMQKCLSFHYGGCRGNNNRFRTLEECVDMCFTVMKSATIEQEQPQIEGHQIQGHSSDEVHGRHQGHTDTGSRKEGHHHGGKGKKHESRCKLDKDNGPCRGAISKFYYDTTMEKCLPFLYGGCRGNENRFNGMDECVAKCHQSERKETKNKGDKVEKKKKKKEDRKKNKGKRVDCVVSQWSDWAACSQTCGKGFKTKQRTVTQQPQHGGKKCPKRLERRKRCKNKCPKKQRHNGVGKFLDSPQECVVGRWSHWSPCSATCGQAYKYKRRDISHKRHGRNITCPRKIRRRKLCDLPDCRVDCVMGVWGEWTPCAQTCGSYSIQERTRAIVQHAKPGGLDCGARIERRYCSMSPCPTSMQDLSREERRRRLKNLGPDGS